MLRFAYPVVLLAIFTAVSPAVAQSLTAEERAACQADYNQYCKGTTPGGGRIIACLNAQYAQLSDACKKVVDAQKK
jgi:hypothetical protein